LASDISNIIKSEISNTLESLLSVSSKVEEVVQLKQGDLDQQQCVKVGAKFEFADNASSWNFYIPTAAATQFEYLMLGGAIDLKDTIDDEITDALKEIASTISGSITTSVNAQGFGDISGLKFTIGENNVVQCNDIPIEESYKFIFTLNEDKFEMVISFDSVINHVSC